MKRREALKNIGLTLGYSALVPSALSILQSCTTEEAKWIPIFFTPDEGIIIKNLVDLILPKTEATPGALDVNVPEFLDLYASKAYNMERKKQYKKDIKSFINELPITKGGASALKTEDYKALLDFYLKPNKTKELSLNTEQKNAKKALLNLRNQTIWAYKTSEKIGEDILAYDPIPAAQKGCISVEEATGGKSWSL